MLIVRYRTAHIAWQEEDETELWIGKAIAGRIAKIDQKSVDLDGVPRRLDVQPFEECRRRKFETGAPIRGNFRFERLVLLVGEGAEIRDNSGLAAAVQRKPFGLGIAGETGVEQLLSAGSGRGTSGSGIAGDNN